MTDEEMLALMNYSLQRDDSRQLGFDLRLEKGAVQDDSGQYLMFGERCGIQQ